MTNKLYYSNPIHAAYMSQEFGVKFGIKYQGKLVWDWIDMLNKPHPAMDAEDILYDYPEQSFGNLYIHPDSLDIFEPKRGDYVQVNNKFGSVYFVSKVDESGAPYRTFGGKYRHIDNVKKIIQRDNKAFIMAEIEND